MVARQKRIKIPSRYDPHSPLLSISRSNTILKVTCILSFVAKTCKRFNDPSGSVHRHQRSPSFSAVSSSSPSSELYHTYIRGGKPGHSRECRVSRGFYGCFGLGSTSFLGFLRSAGTHKALLRLLLCVQHVTSNDEGVRPFYVLFITLRDPFVSLSRSNGSNKKLEGAKHEMAIKVGTRWGVTYKYGIDRIILLIF